MHPLRFLCSPQALIWRTAYCSPSAPLYRRSCAAMRRSTVRTTAPPLSTPLTASPQLHARPSVSCGSRDAAVPVPSTVLVHPVSRRCVRRSPQALTTLPAYGPLPVLYRLPASTDARTERCAAPPVSAARRSLQHSVRPAVTLVPPARASPCARPWHARP
ncbi:hypothetical protein B0H15DRAFT_815624 [Mycena belliarum]|uniref:Uncharacterized protein n=1 Tax=Mycena belliarum TaxID=1033014 RepID=A0AAD6UM14_9AGAR|nr:hypothetical protein B0H15DRAFT_815624 [Mycena belliae]